jgi:Ca2+-binding RTX toxin-like protein
LVHQRFGLISFHGQGGSDVYRDQGKGNIDMVYVQAGGQDRVSTGSRGDRLRLEPGGHHGRVQARLGSGEDTFDVRVGRVHGRLDGGAGPDRLDIDHHSTSGWTLDNTTGIARDDGGSRRLSWRSVDYFVLRELLVPTLTFLGSDVDEGILQDPGSPVTDRFSMGGGDDTVHAGAGDDFLDGGPGTDTIAGGPGTDTCLAEVRYSCELP